MNIWWHLRQFCILVRETMPDQISLSDAGKQAMARLIAALPADDFSIAGAEGQAIYHEACGNPADALRWRQAHLERLHRLHQTLDEDDYSEKLRAALLEYCDEEAIAVCLQAIQRLETAIGAADKPR
ncbi:hypothetical protein [Blastopirellula marina]|uniref:Uncharacterized protein n=1 Tax=Blastopirellula marina TaxID=124 RepID=A0A2S8G6Y0_9BACT|nr:hypothetical protein [Blastopirellula marina]PQO40189.1 hypothetical protein C5Y98_06180 [Blastopirellula marina]PTL45556.1 hypothetical protein C5Y97_06180 [Blastopirellula marina]